MQNESRFEDIPELPENESEDSKKEIQNPVTNVL